MLCLPPPGCGTGNYLAALSEFVGKMTGVEQNEGMLEQSRQKTAHLANVEIFQGNILSLPFPDQQFDGVVCNQAMKNNNRFKAALFHICLFVFCCFAVLFVYCFVCLFVCLFVSPYSCSVGWHWTNSLCIELVHLSPSRKERRGS